MSIGTGMFRSLPAIVLLALLAGCASAPPSDAAVPARGEVGNKAKGSCAQSNWQAETAPVINKRQGNEALEKYDGEEQEPGSGCH